MHLCDVKLAVLCHPLVAVILENREGAPLKYTSSNFNKLNSGVTRSNILYYLQRKPQSNAHEEHFVCEGPHMGQEGLSHCRVAASCDSLQLGHTPENVRCWCVCITVFSVVHLHLFTANKLANTSMCFSGGYLVNRYRGKWEHYQFILSSICCLICGWMFFQHMHHCDVFQAGADFVWLLMGDNFSPHWLSVWAHSETSSLQRDHTRRQRGEVELSKASASQSFIFVIPFRWIAGCPLASPPCITVVLDYQLKTHTH